jgi:class 3 adenylate cyclase
VVISAGEAQRRRICVVAIQQTTLERNTAVEPTRRIEFRVGISLGDVIHDDARVYGDRVNIAARLESIADAGGICISVAAYDQVHKKLPQGFLSIRTSRPRILRRLGEGVAGRT